MSGPVQTQSPAWLRAYLGIAALLLMQASFTLAKTLHDEHEVERGALPPPAIGREGV